MRERESALPHVPAMSRITSMQMPSAVASPPAIEIAPDEIRLWWVDLPSICLPAMAEHLTDTERNSARRLAQPGAPQRALAARAALRAILSWHTGREPGAITLHEGKDIKPSLVGDRRGLRFNVSHSGRLALIAVAHTGLGIDVEAVVPSFDWQGVAGDFFHARDRHVLAASPEERRVDVFFRLWTRKEAYLKGVGRGSLDDMRAFFVSDAARSDRRRGRGARCRSMRRRVLPRRWPRVRRRRWLSTSARRWRRCPE